MLEWKEPAGTSHLRGGVVHLREPGVPPLQQSGNHDGGLGGMLRRGEEDECGLDRALIWTSDHAYQSENANLWRFVEDLQKANLELQEEWMTSRAKSRNLKALYEAQAAKPRKKKPDPDVVRMHQESEEAIESMKSLDKSLERKTNAGQGS
mmetsp:Transcript_55833/g.161729  ORF Transcript_55833/g.161729 Transcript_55833/m.161729 type:complete len:151 (-) Transcript_55833:150-602(-)